MAGDWDSDLEEGLNGVLKVEWLGGGIPYNGHLGDVLKATIEDRSPDVHLKPSLEVIGARHVVELVEDGSRLRSVVVWGPRKVGCTRTGSLKPSGTKLGVRACR